jgi:tRNA (mo5U34)-methyltransferase
VYRTAVTAPAEPSSLRQTISEIDWYHTIEVAPGVLTKGWFDTREVAAELPWPPLTGKRCLDVGTFDGFWAFEMERRGAAEVVAVDLLDPDKWDWPTGSAPDTVAEVGRRKAKGRGFEIAREALGSSVTRHAMSVYDLDPAEVGTFDFVYVGSLLLHLRDPVRALERVRGVCTGSMLLVDAIDLPLSVLFPHRPTAMLDGIGRPWWWKPNAAGLARMAESAGFEVTAPVRRIYMPPGADQHRTPVKPRVLLDREGREAAMRTWRGDPHGIVQARPR